MILYDFQCLSCSKTKEKLFHFDDCPESILCECGERAEKILVHGHGGIRTDNKVKWLASACKVLQREGERPLETRTQYREYLKKNNLTSKA